MTSRKKIALRAKLFCFLTFFGTTTLIAGGSHDHESHSSSESKDRSSTPFLEPYQPHSILAAQTTLGPAAQFGQWSDVMSWPLIAVHANLLPNGKVLAWDATPDDFDAEVHTTDSFTTRVSLWDPQTNRHSPTINDTNGDLFCAGSAQLWDGRVLFAGGDSGTNGTNAPLSNTNIYDPTTNTWREVQNMAAPRWYASVAALANGEMLTYAGRYTPVPIAEVFQLDEKWRSLGFGATPGMSINYQWLQATPEGKVLSFGPQNTLTSIETEGTGAISLGQRRDNYPLRRYGSYAMYDIGKVLVSGGTTNEGGVASFRSSVIIDTATEQTTDTSGMKYGRTQHNLTILADGSVLATGGNTDGAPLVSETAGVYRPEIWSAETGQWREANDMQVDRQYHAIALLLPDGRVLSAGGGYCGTCTEIGYEEQNAEIFSPPYLFSTGNTLAVRPVITNAPQSMDYNRDYTVTSNQTSDIAKAHIIKLGAVTHSQNQDQRLIPLTFSKNGNELKIKSPTNRNIAPPGHYMLFIVNDSGVPSVSKIIRVGQPLLKTGTTVRNAIRNNETDEYVINSNSADKALLVKVFDQNRPIQLEVTGESQNGTTTANCEKQASEYFECRLSNKAATRWKIKLDSSSQTPYTLIANLSRQDDPSAIQPDASAPTTTPTPSNNIATEPRIIVGTSGGSFGIWLLLLLCGFNLFRRR